MKWNEVTWYSRLGAVILFLAIVPMLAFYIGMRYGQLTEISNIYNAEPVHTTSQRSTAKLPSITTQPFDGKNATFTIGGAQVTLTDGISEVPAAPGSASMVTTRYFGNEAVGDISGDDKPDTAFLVTQETGGSGTFYYVVAAIPTKNGYKTTNAILLGDRISPQTTEINDEELIVNYANRASGEPMSTKPSVGKSIYLALDPITFKLHEVSQGLRGDVQNNLEAQ